MSAKEISTCKIPGIAMSSLGPGGGELKSQRGIDRTPYQHTDQS